MCPAHAGPPIEPAAFLNSKCEAKRSIGDAVQMEESVEGGSSREGSHFYADVVRINETEYRTSKGELVYKDNENEGVA